MNTDNLPGPCSVRQEMYMFPEKYAYTKDGKKHKEQVDIVLYGGSAGGGKSEIGVIDFLKWTEVEGFIGVITRRTTPQLTGPGGILTKAKRVFGQAYSPDEYTYRAKDNKFVFHKSGAEIYLRHFENDNADMNWQGIEANLFYIDEGTQYTQHMVQYIMSRMRNPSCPHVKPHLKITCNPDPDHFLFKWVEPYLTPEGTPDRDKDGWVRFMTFSDGDFAWGDSKEEVARKYGVQERDVLSFTFISATVFDNPILQKVNPKYVSWLKGLKGVERERLLLGNWKVREKGSQFFERSWLTELPYIDENEVMATARAFDFAGTLISDINPSPDYTASVRIRKMKNGRYVIDDIRRTRIRMGDWEDFVLSCAEFDPPDTKYLIPQDPNPFAKKATLEFVKGLAEKGLYVVKVKSNNRGKLDRFRPFSSVAQNEWVDILANCGNDLENGHVNDNSFYYAELEAFTGERRRGELYHDDKHTCRH